MSKLSRVYRVPLYTKVVDLARENPIERLFAGRDRVNINLEATGQVILSYGETSGKGNVDCSKKCTLKLKPAYNSIERPIK